MKKWYFIFIIFFLANSAFAQNLVLNPSFEEINSNCCTYPPGIPKMLMLCNWSSPNIDYLNADWGYWNTCYICNPNVSVYIPNVGFGYQFPATGEGFTGVFGFDSIAPNFREYLQGELADPLIPGVNYIISIRVSLADDCYYSYSKLGVFFSDHLIDTNASYLPYTPQIELNDYVLEKENWQKIYTSFIASDTTQYFCLGNFCNTSELDTIYSGSGSNKRAIVYYFDDVAIYPADAPVYAADAGGDQMLCEGESLVLGSPYRSQYLYWWYDAEGNLIDTTAQITVSPENSTYYVLHQKDFKFDESYDTAFVYVSDCADPLYIPNIFSPNGDGNNDIFWVRGEGISEIKNFIVYNRWGEEVHNCKCNEIGHGSNCCGWNGTYHGEDAPVGVYVYYVEAVLLNGETVVKRGNVTLVR
ncbi:MAG: gliding motility-associated C-terminal domain-containing protein [Bacteroidales bacterium]|nr:gliding motility-associated C-terminal domain-containing protein [Bacteroidales bacterium]